MDPDIVILGSANLDLVYRVERIPRPGETLLASGAAQHPGGKGNNQAIAAARAGGRVAFIAALGDDEAARLLLATLEEAKVELLVRTVAAATGTALITVENSGENTVIVNSAANAALLGLTEAEHSAIRSARFLLMQLETPTATVVDAARSAEAGGTAVVINAAPARALPGELLGLVDVLIVNEHEALLVAAGLGAQGLPAEVSVENAAMIGAALFAAARAVVITLGSSGSVVVEPGGATHVPAHRVEAVDTTGAGDTLCGALVAGLASGMSLVAATAFATTAAAISVQRAGAVPSIPTKQEIEEFGQ